MSPKSSASNRTTVDLYCQHLSPKGRRCHMLIDEHHLPANGAGRPTLCARSEEHTSELQSRSDLVCRLLLEKKKKQKIIHRTEYHAYLLSLACDQPLFH